MIQLLLSFPPSVNHYWGQRGNHKFLGKRGKEFRQEVAEACLEDGIKTLHGRLAVHVAIFPPDRRKRDVDNILKPLLDACEHAGCFVDDSQIDELHIIRQGIKKGGACTILILEL